MTDFNKVLDPGDVEKGIISVVIDIPKGSTLKIEWDRDRACFFIDRVDPSIYPQPDNYGFIPQTLDEDGDELDAIVVCSQVIPTGVYLRARVIGVLYFADEKGVDDKIICVPEDDRDTDDMIKSLDDLGNRWKQKVEEHFKHYKDLWKPGSTNVKGWAGIEEAKEVIRQCIDRYKS